MSFTQTFSLWVRITLQGIQSKLSFEGWSAYPQFSTDKGLGRVAMLACILGILLGIHALAMLEIILHQCRMLESSQTVADLLGPDRMQLLLQWCMYAVAVCTFHLMEFFVTAVSNPTMTTSNAFLINHSIAYTAAALLSWMEFWIRFWFFPRLNTKYMMILGIAVTAVGQFIRSLAMVTCGESFNHLIQQSKKENHVLITHGIYKFLRHPSYVGFYYWAVGTQLLLGNPLHTVLFAVAAWMFFHRRIPYEEESLMRLFPDEYPGYVASTYIGIPFLSTRIETTR